MGRPRKPDGERLVPACVSLTPARFDALDRIAKARRMSLSELLREVIDSRFRKYKTTDIQPSC